MGVTTHELASIEALIALLDEARARTLLLVAPLSDEDLRVQHDPLMSPVLWDLGHIAHFEQLWLTDNLAGEIRFSEMPGMYNPFEHPRRVRGALVYPSKDDAIALMARIRARVVERLRAVGLDPARPLTRGGYVVYMVLQHEYQHNETILQTLQLKQGAPYAAPRRSTGPSSRLLVPSDAMVAVPGGTYRLGTEDQREAYDNERPPHAVTLSPYFIDVAPVRNGEYLAFMHEHGYEHRQWWSDAGWQWVQETGAQAPKYWEQRGGAWQTRVMDRWGPPDPDAPVCHVCYHEAEAYARWAGKRLPTEAEWEVAAAFDPVTGAMRRFPWGEEPPTPEIANVDQLTFGTAPVGAYHRNVSALGCYGMIGDVWEWTASDFQGYPGFEAFPYPEYSAVFFGDEYKVLRGGSWATRPGAIRNTFRNWDYPMRRQIFSGFRCARDG